MRDILDRVQSAENIFVPKGDDREPCTLAFQEFSGIEVPPFRGERLKSLSEGRMFWLFKGIDVPGLVVRYGAVGIAGTDSIVESRYRRPPITPLLAHKIGAPMCRFSILAEQEKVNVAETILNADSRCTTSLTIPTSRPRLLSEICSWRDLGFVPLEDPIVNGSMESMASLTGIGIAADLVKTGKTAKAMDLQEVSSLCDIYPEIVLRTDESL
jgi:ATP phosphoribosyltransferase